MRSKADLFSKISRRCTAALLAATLTLGTGAQACTSFVIRTQSGGIVYGRTMEFGFDLKSAALLIPRHLALASTGADGKPGAMKWTSKYAAVGLNGVGDPILVDGLNEKGLAGGILYFPGYAGYADASKTDPAKSLAPWDFLTWALTNFATVAEVKAALSGIAVVGIKEIHLGFAPPVHYTLHDASGGSLVIEPIDGTLKVYDNPFGVMTNSPPFDWQVTNLRNYVKISPVNAPPLQIGGQTVASFGQGSGLLGIPGDPTPPSRFVRALGYAASAERQPDGIASVRAAEHILNNFDIPKGWIRPDSGGESEWEFTEWSAVADLTNLVYYVKAYDDQVLRSIDLKTQNLDAPAIVSAPLVPRPEAPALTFAKP
ncbi:choloylglycine hydrolase [Methylovirgula ligni]|uniref:Penicillin amidase n=1 Tax=Methylovirgula ligni TaxID=569860 RepID=A0A3D9YZT9_9HYPH|nr:choloylglycine hydrolase family protein [Methylovirgula ligni]QAY97027.1 choloylglycine hydrolase [Methylovirgula ligni]REF87905.1 penicillin amidase [Methylovirgula ligni]